jgi:hypothetical protein
MNASPLLIRVAKLVTKADIDFPFRETPSNLKKLKALARSLDAYILRSYYPFSGLYRIARDEDGLQLDFMTIDGIRSFEGLRRRARTVRLDDTELAAPALSDTTNSRRVAGPSSKRPLAKNRVSRKVKLEALKKESELALRDQIRRLLALPPERRCNFLRKRIGYRISCL